MNSQQVSIDDPENKVKKVTFENPLLLKINNFTIQTIIESYEKRENLGNILIKESQDKNILEIDNLNLKFIGIIFREPIKVKYTRAIVENVYCTIIDEKVYSDKQIDNCLKKYNMIYPKFINNENEEMLDYYKSKYLLFWNIRNNEINIINSYKECKLEESKIILLNKNNFSKDDLSSYFDDYFIYPYKNKDFNYYYTPNRKKLEQNLSRLLNDEEISQFKLTGPSGEGKSISLLYFSRCSFNTIYLNLKTIYSLYTSEHIEKYLDLLIYEFGRLKFENNKNKKLFEETFNKNSLCNFWELLEQLSQVLKDHEVLFIFDQFKEKYINRKCFGKIKENLKNNLKIIISSSINDHEIGSQTANSLIKHKNEHFQLTKDNQNDYFYYTDLIYLDELKKLIDNKDVEKNKLYYYFGWNPKFICLIDKKTTKEELKEQIKNKMKIHSENIGVDFDLYIFNIYLRINREINYDILPLKTLSLKYCKLTLGKKSFKISYKYPIIKIIVEELIKEFDVKKYFNNKNYEDNELYSSLKGYFFEYAAIKQINFLKDSFFEESIKYTLTVENIVKIKQYEMSDTNDTNDDKTDIFNMIMEQQDNQSIIGQKITKNNLLTTNLTLINNELNIIKKEKEKDEEPEEENDNEDSEENEINEEKDDNIIESEGEEEEEENIKIMNNNNKNNNINYYFYKNLKKEKNKIEKLLGIKTKRTEIETDEINTRKKLKKKDNNLNENVKYNKYNDNFQNGGIMINQKQINGEALDLGVLLGNKDNKKFIGFQMKFYSKNSGLKKKITKDSLKRRIQPILINSFKNFGIKITEWHYIMCLYYNNEDEYEYNLKLVKNCNNNDIEFIFFNPTKNVFYDSNKEEIKKIKLNMKTNIDFNSKVNAYLIMKDTGLIKEYLNQVYYDNILISENNTIFNINKNVVVNYAKQIIGKNIEIICKLELIKDSHFPIPNDSILFLFGNEQNLVYYYNLNNKLHCQIYRSINNKYTTHFNYTCPSLIPSYLNIDKKLKSTDKIYFYVFKIKN